MMRTDDSKRLEQARVKAAKARLLTVTCLVIGHLLLLFAVYQAGTVVMLPGAADRWLVMGIVILILTTAVFMTVVFVSQAFAAGRGSILRELRDEMR